MLGFWELSECYLCYHHTKPRSYLTPILILILTYLSLPNSRTQETEADVLGFKYATRACYVPRVVVGVFERLGEIEGRSTTTTTSSSSEVYSRSSSWSSSGTNSNLDSSFESESESESKSNALTFTSSDPGSGSGSGSGSTYSATRALNISLLRTHPIGKERMRVLEGLVPEMERVWREEGCGNGSGCGSWRGELGGR